jgi:hypothetical protein
MRPHVLSDRFDDLPRFLRRQNDSLHQQGFEAINARPSPIRPRGGFLKVQDIENGLGRCPPIDFSQRDCEMLKAMIKVLRILRRGTLRQDLIDTRSHQRRSFGFQGLDEAHLRLPRSRSPHEVEVLRSHRPIPGPNRPRGRICASKLEETPRRVFLIFGLYQQASECVLRVGPGYVEYCLHVPHCPAHHGFGLLRGLGLATFCAARSARIRIRSAPTSRSRSGRSEASPTCASTVAKYALSPP